MGVIFSVVLNGLFTRLSYFVAARTGADGREASQMAAPARPAPAAAAVARNLRRFMYSDLGVTSE